MIESRLLIVKTFLAEPILVQSTTHHPSAINLSS